MSFLTNFFKSTPENAEKSTQAPEDQLENLKVGKVIFDYERGLMIVIKNIVQDNNQGTISYTVSPIGDTFPPTENPNAETKNLALEDFRTFYKTGDL